MMMRRLSVLVMMGIEEIQPNRLRCNYYFYFTRVLFDFCLGCLAGQGASASENRII